MSFWHHLIQSVLGSFFSIWMWLPNWKMRSNDHPRCNVCYDLEGRLARMVDRDCNGPYGNDQSIKKFDDGSVLVYIIRDLVRAQLTKCIFCALITRVDSSPGPGTHLLRLEPGRTPVIDMDSARRRRRFEIYRPTDLAPELEANSIALEVSGLSPFQHIPKRHDISSQPLSDRAFTFIKACLETCAQKHSVCRQGTSHPPKRLIDIRDLGSACVKVIETSFDFREPYVALSYCWGQGVCLKTTKSNILEMMTGIECTNLPSIISDAIRITSVLGFKYIWVDSLCIIQDDVQDWEAESARMCSIYEGAYLTIAASSAESADVSLAERHRRHEPTVFRCCQSTDPTDRKKTSAIVQLAVREECEYGFHNEDAARRPDREPLHDRGWTLQEAILSTRVVFYTPTELQWQCQAVQTCECQIPPPTKLGVITTRAHMQGSSGRPRQPREIFAAWDRIVETYTERLLTNPEDKLPALSGLARLVRRNISIAMGLHNPDFSDEPPLPRQLEYVAGLWADDLIRGMLWDPLHMTVQLPSSPLQTTTTTSITGANVLDDTSLKIEESPYYRAPSFSWASVDGPVTYRSRNLNLSQDDTSYVETARVIDVWSQPASKDPFGRLITAENPQHQRHSRTGVVLRAPLIEHCALVWNSSKIMHNSPWTLREIEPQQDKLWLDTEVVESFPVAERLASREEQDETNCKGEDQGELEDLKPRWSVRRTRRKRVRNSDSHGLAGESRSRSRREIEKGTVMGGVSLLMMAQNAQVQRFLLLGISPSDPAAYERLGTVSTTRVSNGGDLVQLSKETPLHGKGTELEDIEWKGKGGVISRMRTVTII
ncbi:heterokaryon incompatibility protein-domain-containing protein [Xylariaceae sp. AK1471]|nr:heterokaryon incompatibility protein-domain-containing protein [Xylariaceae sp. AK1471]